MRKLIATVIVGVLLSVGQVATAGPFEDGQVAYDRLDFVTAFKLWRPLAERGVVAAQLRLATMFSLGWGVPQNYTEQANWVRMAAEQGDAEGQYLLGRLYGSGRGVPQDSKEAVKWNRMAAEQQYADAFYLFGQMFRDGTVVLQDFVRAHMWFNLAATSLGGQFKTMAPALRNELASMMTPAQIERAQEMARKCQESKFKDCGW